MYHPTISALNQAASGFHLMGMLEEKQQCFRIAGRLQQKLLTESPYGTGYRFFTAQWVWALGHIGLLHQVMRWLATSEPETICIVEAEGAANPYFLNALLGHFSTLKVCPKLPDITRHVAMHNAMFFGCPDGNSTLVDYYKKIERVCKGTGLLRLTAKQKVRVEQLKKELGLDHAKPIVAIQHRNLQTEPERNTGLDMVKEHLSKYRDHEPVITGTDPCDEFPYPSVLGLPDPQEASFLLSASCDQFIGSNSGAWVVPHGFGRPVELLNDYEKSAWIYP